MSADTRFIHVVYFNEALHSVMLKEVARLIPTRCHIIDVVKFMPEWFQAQLKASKQTDLMDEDGEATQLCRERLVKALRAEAQEGHANVFVGPFDGLSRFVFMDEDFKVQRVPYMSLTHKDMPELKVLYFHEPLKDIIVKIYERNTQTAEETLNMYIGNLGVAWNSNFYNEGNPAKETLMNLRNALANKIRTNPDRELTILAGMTFGTFDFEGATMKFERFEKHLLRNWERGPTTFAKVISSQEFAKAIERFKNEEVQEKGRACLLM